MQLSIMIATPVPKRSPLGKSDGSAERGSRTEHFALRPRSTSPRQPYTGAAGLETGSGNRSPKTDARAAPQNPPRPPPLGGGRERLAKNIPNYISRSVS